MNVWAFQHSTDRLTRNPVQMFFSLICEQSCCVPVTPGAQLAHTHNHEEEFCSNMTKNENLPKKKRKKRQRFQLRSSKTYLSVADSRGQQKQRGDTSRQHLDADKQKRRKQKVRFSEET